FKQNINRNINNKLDLKSGGQLTIKRVSAVKDEPVPWPLPSLPASMSGEIPKSSFHSGCREWLHQILAKTSPNTLKPFPCQISPGTPCTIWMALKTALT
ncbi:MAG: hypothetical protein J0I90_10225, partial [Nitrosospira sp.]|nr:hypothetical protein [Nitrosospira sp.]